MGEAKRRKRQLSALELSPQLQRQIEFLKRSAEAFDNGFEDEAVRMATVIRVLLHESATSKALLKQLGPLPNFWDGAIEFDPQNVMTQSGLVATTMGPSGAKHVAPLDDVTESRRSAFESWWESKVFAIDQNRTLSRRELILTAANQDGGAHVDPQLDEVYYDLSKNALGWFVGTDKESVPLGSPLYPAIRQIAHEVLKSLVWAYECKSDRAYHVMFMGASIKPAG